MKLRIAVAIAVSIVLTNFAAIGAAEEAGSGKGSDNGASATAATVQALKRGGFVLYLRHVSSDTSKPDRVPSVDFNDCATQRPLSSEGRRQAAQIGKAVRSLGIPIGEVRVSPYCRTKETAELAAETLGLGKDAIVYDDRIAEVNTGDFSGCSIETYRAYFTSTLEKFDKPTPHGETLTEMKKRIGEFLYDIDQRYKGKKVLIIAHEYSVWLMNAVAKGAGNVEGIPGPRMIRR